MRLLSATARRALAGEETAEVFLYLLTIDNLGLPAPLYFVNDTQDLDSRGEDPGNPAPAGTPRTGPVRRFLACPFQISLPEDRDDQLGQVVLSLDNIDRNLVAAVRAIQNPPTVTLEVVLAGTPNTLEAGPFAFTLRQSNYDSLVVQGTLMFEDLLNELYPADIFAPHTTPALWA